MNHSHLFCIAAAALLWPAHLPADDDATGNDHRACAAEEIVGTWDMVDMHIDVNYGVPLPQLYPYQTFVFAPDGGFHLFSGTSPIDETQKNLLMSTTPTPQSYTFNANTSSIDVSYPATHALLHYTCLVLASGQEEKLMLISSLGSENYGVDLKRRVE